jgi:hypothetical protein
MKNLIERKTNVSNYMYDIHYFENVIIEIAERREYRITKILINCAMIQEQI